MTGTLVASEPAATVRITHAPRGWWGVTLDWVALHPHDIPSAGRQGWPHLDQPSPGRVTGPQLPTCLTALCPPQTTYRGKSSFQTYSDYLRWESFLQQQLQVFPEGSALRHGFQTCEHWKQIFMEIIGERSPAPHPRITVGWGGDLGQGGPRVACLSHSLSSSPSWPGSLENWNDTVQEHQSEARASVSCWGPPGHIL